MRVHALACFATIFSPNFWPHLPCLQAGDMFAEPASAVALLEQCIDSIVARGDWSDAGQMLRLQTAGDLLACLLGMEGQPWDE